MRGVHEGRTIREGNGRRPYRSTSWRPEDLLGPKQLAGPMPSAPQHEDKERGPDAGVSLLRDFKQTIKSSLLGCSDTKQSDLLLL